MRLPLKPQTEYAGHLDRLEAIEPPKDILAAIEASDIAAAPTEPVVLTPEDEVGETGNEAAEVLPDKPILATPTTTTPKPTITEETDHEGQVIPRATPISE